jgi:hypothetical protein
MAEVMLNGLAIYPRPAYAVGLRGFAAAGPEWDSQSKAAKRRLFFYDGFLPAAVGMERRFSSAPPRRSSLAYAQRSLARPVTGGPRRDGERSGDGSGRRSVATARRLPSLASAVTKRSTNYAVSSSSVSAANAAKSVCFSSIASIRPSSPASAIASLPARVKRAGCVAA